MSHLEVPSCRLGKHLSEVAWGELRVFAKGKQNVLLMSLLLLTLKNISS